MREWVRERERGRKGGEGEGGETERKVDKGGDIERDARASLTPVHATSERKGNSHKYFKNFYLKAKA